MIITSAQKKRMIPLAGAVLAIPFIALGSTKAYAEFDISQVNAGVGERSEQIQDLTDRCLAQNITVLSQLEERNTDTIVKLFNAMNTDCNTDIVANEVRLASTKTDHNDVPGPLLDIDNVDNNYTGTVIRITGPNKTDLESLVFNEAGDQGFIGACLVAQTIRDEMVATGCYSARDIKARLKYQAPINGRTNSVAKSAVNYIFDHGGVAVRHRLFYFYAPKLVSSSFHESQNFVVEYNEHRFFDRK